MPFLTKRVISQFIRRDCHRQLRLLLSPENEDYRHEREAAGMPDPHNPRPGLELVAQEGRKWELEKIRDLQQTFGEELLIAEEFTNDDGEQRFRDIPLEEEIEGAEPYQFLAQPSYEVTDTFVAANNLDHLDLDYSDLIPDLIQVMPPGEGREAVHPDGSTELVEEQDRIPLRVVDIKLTAEPNASYFAEVTYYGMVLAAWLIDHGLDQTYYVTTDLAVWPGSHEGSTLVQKKREFKDQGVPHNFDDLLAALEEDLESVPFTVFSSRLQTFFEKDLPKVLGVDDWENLPWHVDNRCNGCRYLGHRWVSDQDERYCMPMAERDNDLSRVAYVSRGASDSLEDSGIETVPELAGLSADDDAFNQHHTLRATRTVVSGRAESLGDHEAGIPSDAGSSAIMPQWADLRVYLMVDFDVGSAITLSLGLKAFWLEPYGPQDRDYQAWDEETFIVDVKDPDVERRELLNFLESIHNILSWAENRDADTTVQLYIWDQVQYKHLTRIVGRHLHYILEESGFDYLAWLFPSEDIVPDPQHASKDTSITIVGNVVRSILAAPIPHVYSLLRVAREYHPDSIGNPDAAFSVHPHFEDDFSSLVPSERAHHIWSRKYGDYPWHDQLEDLKESVEARLRALEAVTQKLEEDLRDQLQNTAPRIDIGPPEREPSIGWDGQLWMAFAKLNSALEQMDVDSARAMPPHEREARFKSALLSERLEGTQRRAVLDDYDLSPDEDYWVYQMESESTETKFREGDFTLCLAPNRDTSELNHVLPYFVDDHGISDEAPLPDEGWVYQKRVEHATQVRIETIDREQARIVLEPTSDFPGLMELFEDAEIYDFSSHVSLELMHEDFFIRKLRRTLRSIGNPDVQRDDPLVRRAVGLQSARIGRRSEHTPVADVLWQANELAEQSLDVSVETLETELRDQGMALNASQWEAWRAASSHRLRLIWGPPGTGKTRTVHAIVAGKIWNAINHGGNGRILITAPTYRALDTVLEKVVNRMQNWGLFDDLEMHRIRSKFRDEPEGQFRTIDTEMTRDPISKRLQTLKRTLNVDEGIVVVGATPQQVHNLIRTNDSGSGQKELFDHVIVDEASQMDVAESVLAYAAIAEDGAVVVAGDPLQLAPIHQAEPPDGLEALVGATYEFFREIHGVPESKLLRNYRSNEEIVEFQKFAGYPVALEPHSPNLAIDLVNPLPSEPPAQWPNSLPWGSFLESVMDPTRPCICITYPGGLDSQWNEFESQLAAAILSALQPRLSDQLLHEQSNETSDGQDSSTMYTTEAFWQSGVGVVTPHKAQEASIVRHLQQHSDGRTENEAIRDAVDTVERFQGQQRDVIVASYAVSDPDLIDDEDEFLQGKNRFNVLQSRARAKVIVLVSEELIQHLSSDVEILEESALLKEFAMVFCNESERYDIQVPGGESRSVTVRYHDGSENSDLG